MTARILAIEDDPAIAKLLRRGLELAGYAVDLAADGGQGRTAWARGGYGAVLLDVMLPDVHGLDLLAERRAAGDTTPVVLVTAREEAELRRRGEAAGASAYLAKPFAYTELIAVLDRVCARQ